MSFDLAQLSQTRYTTKAFDPARKIPAETLEQLLTALRNSPSSVNSQPWHFVVASSDEAKARLAKATQPGYAYNEAKILNASDVIVFCVRSDLDQPHLEAVLDKEAADGRLANAEAKATQHKTRCFYTDLHRFERKDLQFWMEKQVYIALGVLLLGAATVQVDACPIEGFDTNILDAELGLRERGLTSLVLVSLGYHSSEDFNAKLPKSRLEAEQVFTRL